MESDDVMMTLANASTLVFDPNTYEGSLYVDVKYALVTMTASFLFFVTVRFGVNRFGVPTSMKGDVFRWSNTYVSWIHAIISGSLVIYCLCFKREIYDDLILYCDYFTYTLLSFSLGYFIYDLFDHVVNKKVFVYWEVIVHHFMAITMFWYHVYFRIQCGFTVVSLKTEVNSIFLHARKLQLFQKWPLTSLLYRFVITCNMVTFVSFRVYGILQMTVGIYYEWDRLTPYYRLMIAMTCFVMNGINCVLLWRLIKNDVLRNFKDVHKTVSQTHENGASHKLHRH